MLLIDGSVTDASSANVVTASTGTVGSGDNTATSVIVRTVVLITAGIVGVAAIDDDTATAMVVPIKTTFLGFRKSSDRKTKGSDYLSDFDSDGCGFHDHFS